MFLYLSVSHSVHSGGRVGGVCPSACWDAHPPGPEAGTPREQCTLGDMGNKRAVRILLECILVIQKFHFNLWLSNIQRYAICLSFGVLFIGSSQELTYWLELALSTFSNALAPDTYTLYGGLKQVPCSQFRGALIDGGVDDWQLRNVGTSYQKWLNVLCFWPLSVCHWSILFYEIFIWKF